ncbi:hypothetical protein GCM10025777_32630 [Membranihabitans marinus]|uniref:N-acetyltransferase domain-containing protein n=3 Tax=Nesterenkonia TaxID=57494 RepID=A0ABP9FUL5_9MICC
METAVHPPPHGVDDLLGVSGLEAQQIVHSRSHGAQSATVPTALCGIAAAQAAYTVPMTHGHRIQGSVILRELLPEDAEPLAAAYIRNRSHLAPWEPARDDFYFTAAGQAEDVEAKIADCEAGRSLPLILEDGELIIGRFNITDIVRGPFLSGHLGYWVDQAYTGRGIATAATRQVLSMAANDGLHRLQASVLVNNQASQTVLRTAGFQKIGLAEKYLKIAGQWQDHLLFQRLLDRD